MRYRMDDAAELTHQLLLAHLCALHKTDLSVELVKWNVHQFHDSDPVRRLADDFVCDGQDCFYRPSRIQTLSRFDTTAQVYHPLTQTWSSPVPVEPQDCPQFV